MRKQPKILPKEPPEGLLMSMAIRHDHALGCPHYYDMGLYEGHGPSHEERLKSTLCEMRKLYDEVAGYGFYEWPKESFWQKICRKFLKK